ncbi:MAG: DNA polymerase IV [Clostridia bacterium]|nr:DNA polymerase IV [Clostridia bacterium]
MKERVIFHCDANSFFASVEIAHNPKFKGMPVAVTGNPEKRTGIILTKNPEAKKFGVETGEAIWQAKLKCPGLICLPPHYDIYEEYSAKLRKIYEKYTDRVESFGIDECWLDMTDTLKFFGDAKDVADRLRRHVRETLGITISVGISFGKLFAKLGSDLKKPDATTVISLKDFKKIVYPLPITSVIGIGSRLEKRYNKIGVFVLGDIVNIPDSVLKKKFGILGLQLKQKLLGVDSEPVRKCDDIAPPKSVGNGTTTIKDVYTRAEIKEVVVALCEEISTRLRNGNFNANSISVTIKTAEFKHYHQTMRMPFVTNTSTHLSRFAMQIIDEFWQYNTPVRAVRICTYNLTNSKQTQLCMFSEEIKNSNLNKALDKIRTKYGYFSISPLGTQKSTNLNLEKIQTKTKKN